MRHRRIKKKGICYPEDQGKERWDFFITMVLLVSCITTPYRIAFGGIEDPLEWAIFNTLIDMLFAVDIIIIFNTAVYDSEYRIIEDRKIIARNYLSFWLWIDLLAIVPFEAFVDQSQGNYQDFTRFIRIGRLYKIIRMTKLLRLLKIVKDRSKFLTYLNEILKIGIGFERLIFFALIFFLMAHIIACIWVISLQFTGEILDKKDANGEAIIDYSNTWMIYASDAQILDQSG
jgi:hypothetical protein